jgi:alkylation response protein AidB-like acyl-CoA dehydrogenase
MCLTEPQSGSDMGNTKCRAVKDGDEYVLNGTKCFITNGGIADIYTVAASTSPELGSAGISLFIVDRNTPGVSVGKEEDKLGIRTSNTTDVIFQDVRIPATNLIGEENKGFAISQKLLARTRPTGMASALGVAQRALDLAVDYAQQRVTFGKPIASRQAIKFKLADMEIRLQTARAQLFYNAQLIDKGIYDGMLGSVTKTCVSEMVFDVANQALQIFGGYGYSREYPVEKLLRDARIFSLFEGTNEIQRMIIGGTLVPKKRN